MQALAQLRPPKLPFRELDLLVKAIGECRSKAEEDRIIAAEVDTLKARLSDPKLDKTRGREYMVRAIYCEMLGHDASFALIPALQLASDTNLLTKKVCRQQGQHRADECALLLHARMRTYARARAHTHTHTHTGKFTYTSTCPSAFTHAQSAWLLVGVQTHACTHVAHVQAAYLALSQLLDRRSELVLLLVNTLLVDLKSDNYIVAASALVVVTKLIGPDLINAGAPASRQADRQADRQTGRQADR